MSPGRMVSNLAGRVRRTRSLSVPLREVQSYFPGWGLPSPSTCCQMVNVTLQDWTACSSWRIWLLVSPRCCCSSWSWLAARLMRFQMSTSVTRSKRCSSSTTTFVSSLLRSGGWMLPRCFWQGLLAKCPSSDYRVEFITTLRLENRPTQMKNTELLIPMGAKLHTTSNLHNCTTATEVEGGN